MGGKWVIKPYRNLIKSMNDAKCAINRPVLFEDGAALSSTLNLVSVFGLYESASSSISFKNIKCPAES